MEIAADEAGLQAGHAAYGKACLSCVRSKTRCASPRGGGKCERYTIEPNLRTFTFTSWKSIIDRSNSIPRCLRLNKQCEPAPTVRKRRTMTRPAVSTSALANKTAVLEGKLDGIVQMLQRSHVPQGMVPSPPQEETQDVAHSTSTPKAAQENSSYHQVHPPLTPDASATSGVMSHAVPSVTGACQSTPSPSVTIDYLLESEDESDECLERYRTRMVPYFPVVCIEPEVTVAELREQRPCKLSLQARGIRTFR
jgi:hypothetical protein